MQASARPRRRAFHKFVVKLTALLLGVSFLALEPAHAKLEIWRQEGSAAFSKYHRQRVVISDQGRVRLGQELRSTGRLPAERVWDLARTKDGSVFAATGDLGKVFRQAGKAHAGADWTVVLDAADTQALSLAATPEGKVFVGTGPSGQVIEVTEPGHPASKPDPKVQYIWDLTTDAEGNLYAATGPNGQLWKRARDGKWSLLLDSKAAHLLSVAVAADGTVYAGSDGDGLIYRVIRDGKTSVLYDAPQSDIRTLLVAPDGSLYAGTAAEAGGGTGPGRGPSLFSEGSQESDHVASGRGQSSVVQSLPRGHGRPRIITVQAGQPPPRSRPTAPRPPAAGSAAPKPVLPGDNAVYHLEPDGAVREVFRAKALIFALAWLDDRLLVGTGPEGELYEVRDRGAESTPLAKLDNGQVLSLLAEPGGEILLGTGDPGSVEKLSSGFVREGELVSEVHDAKLPCRFGSLSWRAELPAGTSIALRVRTGNVREPDETWSSWSPPQTDPSSARADSPPGRFVQYKVSMATRNPEHTPELSSVALSYRSANVAPEINRLDIPDVSAGDGAVKQTRLNLRWDVSDPNDDELSYVVQVRKEGWPSWIALTDTPITEKSFSWDTTAFPSGHYRVRLSASDRPSNSPGDALSRDRESTSFIIDHDAPQVTVTPRNKQAIILLADGLTRVVKADYALDGGLWTPLFPDDGLFDTLREQVSLSLPDLKPGTHLLMVRATDAAGNVGSGDALFVTKD